MLPAVLFRTYKLAIRLDFYKSVRALETCTLHSTNRLDV